MACPTTSAALEHGSAEGRFFHRGAVEHLSDQTTPENVFIALGRLVRKGYLRPAQPTLRTRQRSASGTSSSGTPLLRDDAEEGPREAHEGLVDWAESVGDRQPEFEEILGSTEQAYLHLKTLGTIDAHRAGSSRREAVVRRAQELRRGNVPAASNLLARAADLILSPIVSPSSSISPRSSPEAATWWARPGSPQK